MQVPLMLLAELESGVQERMTIIYLVVPPKMTGTVRPILARPTLHLCASCHVAILAYCYYDGARGNDGSLLH
jgi:hypothetical protein